MPLLVLFLSLLALIVGLKLWQRARQSARQAFIRHYRFPMGVFVSLKRKYPHLQDKDCQLASQALRQFFLAYLSGGRRFVAMPSQAVDEVWHDFILNTRAYSAFCRQAFGGFLHHTPAVVMSQARPSNEGLRRCWWHCCREENLDPRQPARLPLLFALDAKLKIADDFHYVTDCRGVSRSGSDGGTVYCGGDFADSSVDGSTDGFGDGADSAGDGGGCGGGCGGD